jgi:integrase
MVKALPKKRKRYAVPDPEQRGLYVRVMPKGATANVFAAVTRDPYGKQVWATIGTADVLAIKDARDRAREAIRRIKEGRPAFEPPPVKPESFQAVAEDWLKRHVAVGGLRSRAEIERVLNKNVLPFWGEHSFVDIKRSDIAALLDHVEDHHGPSAADHVLAIVRGIASWYATRHDDYVSPFVRGMRRSSPESRERARILDDGELRLIWKLAESSGTFGGIIRLLLLTAQRREKVAALRRSDLSDGVWRVPAEAREKGTGGELVLPDLALAIISAQPRLAGNPYVFAGRGDGHFNGFSPCKRSFDAKLPEMPDWRLHDLRRTARSLMSRAGVRPDIGERVLGHAIAGVEGVYDRHSYGEQKADALKRLAALIETIVNPPAGNVLPLRAAVS